MPEEKQSHQLIRSGGTQSSNSWFGDGHQTEDIQVLTNKDVAKLFVAIQLLEDAANESPDKNCTQYWRIIMAKKLAKEITQHSWIRPGTDLLTKALDHLYPMKHRPKE